MSSISDTKNQTMTTSSTHYLEVFLSTGTKVGEISKSRTADNHYLFSYTKEWKQTGFPVSPFIPLDGEASSESVRNFLWNLLPEGRGLDELCYFKSISKFDVLAALSEMGFETSGALCFRKPLNADKKLESSTIENEEFTNRFLHGNLNIWDSQSKLSVAGVQDKLYLVKANSGYCLGSEFASSDVIIKFKREKTPCIAINEFFTMTLAGLSGVEVPEIEFKRLNNIAILEVSRFDRVRDSKNQARLHRHVIDGCQVMNLPPTFKYERQFGDDGDGRLYRDGVCFRKLMKIETQDDDYREKLVRWMLFNIINHNFDAHGKSISYFVDHSGLRLAPFYDLVNIGALSGEQKIRSNSGRDFNVPDFFAMSVGEHEEGDEGNFKPPITSFMLADFCDYFGFDHEWFIQFGEAFCKTVSENVSRAFSIATSHELTEQEVEHLEKCRRIAMSECSNIHEQLSQIPEMLELL